MAKKKKKIRLTHDQAVTFARQNVINSYKESKKMELEQTKLNAQKFMQDGCGLRLNDLMKMLLLLRGEQSRIMAEIDNLMGEYSLKDFKLESDLNRILDAEDEFYEHIAELRGEDYDAQAVNREADRFDKDFYRYCGVYEYWSVTSKESVFSDNIGAQNFFGIKDCDVFKGMNLYIGRNDSGDLWASSDDSLKGKIGLRPEWFPEISNGEYYLVTIAPQIYLPTKY